jgi:hypothetical protein
MTWSNLRTPSETCSMRRSSCSENKFLISFFVPSTFLQRGKLQQSKRVRWWFQIQKPILLQTLLPDWYRNFLVDLSVRLKSLDKKTDLNGWLFVGFCSIGDWGEFMSLITVWEMMKSIRGDDERWRVRMLAGPIHSFQQIKTEWSSRHLSDLTIQPFFSLFSVFRDDD